VGKHKRTHAQTHTHTQNNKSNDRLVECDDSCWTRTKYTQQQQGYCDRTAMDIRCPAMLQGPNRKVRAIRYMKYLQEYYMEEKNDNSNNKGGTQTTKSSSSSPLAQQELFIIPNVGHNATEMLSSDIVLNTILPSKE
jgi:hypothetical protein